MIPSWLSRIADFCLLRTGLCYWPVRVRSGIAAGARWTLYPWSAYWRGNFEDSIQQEMNALGDITGWSCWDLGAHYGLYTVGLGRRVGPTGEIISFEPNPESFRRMARHCRMNGLSWARPFQAAVSDSAGTAEFFTYGNLKSTTTHLPYDGEPLTDACEALKVRLIRLDDLCAAGEIRRPQFIKVDVEGHAHKALAGARESIIAARPILLVAFHGQQELDAVNALLLPLGYESRPVTADTSTDAGHVTPDLLYRPLPVAAKTA